MVLFGGAGVYLSVRFGLDVFVYFLMSCIWMSLILLQNAKFKLSETPKITFKKYLHDFWGLISKKQFWLLVGITYFAGYSYNGISTIASALLSTRGATPLLHAMTYSLILPLFMCSGALIGGYLSDKKDSAHVLSLSLLISIITSLIVGFTLDSQASLSLVVSSYALFYFFIGSSTSTLYGFLMQYTSKEFAALEFSIFMGIVNLCDSSSSYLTGQLSTKYNYTQTSLFIGAVCVLSLFLIRRLRKNNA